MGGTRRWAVDLNPATARPALFLDRDGVLNEPVWDQHAGHPESPLDPADVVLADGASEAVRRANEAGLLVVVVSNQPSAAKAIVTVPTIHRVHARVLELLTEQGAVIDHSYLCLHHPAGLDPALTRVCECRKPAPGMLATAAAELDIDLSRSWLVGDTDADLGAARAAGLAGFVVIENPLSAHRRSANCRMADWSTPSPLSAVQLIMDKLYPTD